MLTAFNILIPSVTAKASSKKQNGTKNRIKRYPDGAICRCYIQNEEIKFNI